MKKIVTLLLILLSSACIAQKAKDFKFSLGAGMELPLSKNLSTYSHFGITGTAEGIYSISDHFGLVAQAGYTRFIGNDTYKQLVKSGSTDGKADVGMIPIFGGIDVHYAGIFGKATVGYSKFINFLDGGWAVSPEVGYSVGIVRASVDYNHIFCKNSSPISYVGFHIVIQVPGT